ncbi:amino acid permease [Robiginitalea sp. IMCC44478]|uniref:amino acid permease n=1 Tax=Robiginitalea sp. IMCC44478 TaxID=3459122 RepID=UPI0040428F1A
MKSTNHSSKMGLWMSTSLVVGNMIGAGIFLMPSALAAFGGISVVGWLVSSAGALLLAKVFSRLSRMVAGSKGGPYAFARKGFGDYIGFMVAWGYWISIWVALATIAVTFVSAISVFFPGLKENALLAAGTALAAIWLLTWVNSRGVRASGKMQVVTTALKILPVLAIILGGIFFFQPENFIPFNASGDSSIMAIAATGTMTLYAFLGLESATVPANKVQNPEKTIPKATMTGTLVTTLLYVLSTVAIMGMIPMAELSESTAPFSDAMKIMSGEIGEEIIAAGVAVATFGALNGWILIISQVSEATANDGLFPGIFKKENKYGVPVWGLIVGSGLASLLLLMNYSESLVEQFKFTILLSTTCCLVPYLFSAAAYVILSLQKSLKLKEQVSVVILGSLTFGFALWAIFGAGEQSVFWGFFFLMLGTPVFVWMKWKNKNPEL